jgi:hypothetical protein
LNGPESHLWTILDSHSLRDTKKKAAGLKVRGETQIAQASEQSAERRKAIRYRMNASVIFRWKRPDDQRFQAEGVTRDMSVAGAFILTGTCPPVNALLQMEVILPLSDGGSKAQMKSEMRVLRVDHDIAGTNRSGFSAAGKGFLLRTFSKKASRLVAGLIKDSKESTAGQE